MNSIMLDKNVIETEFSGILNNLSEKEQNVLINRIWLKGQRLTLQSIWNDFSPSITRERVRQIEDSWIKKLWRIIQNTPLVIIQEKAREFIDLNGGLIWKIRLLNELIKSLNLDSKINSNIIETIIQADEKLLKSKPKLNTKVYFYNWLINKQLVSTIHKESIKILKKKKDVMLKISLYEQVKNNLTEKVNITLINSVLDIYDDIVTWEDNLIGLEKWKILNPKTLKDKSIYIMKKEKIPMHFIDISNKITEYLGESVKVNTIHNELIRNEEFVLIGRGLYALKEWGFKSWSVIDVISDILKKRGEAMSTEDIIKSVLKVREVKKTTVYMNLQNRNIIKRVGRNYYDLV